MKDGTLIWAIKDVPYDTQDYAIFRVVWTAEGFVAEEYFAEIKKWDIVCSPRTPQRMETIFDIISFQPEEDIKSTLLAEVPDGK